MKKITAIILLGLLVTTNSYARESKAGVISSIQVFGEGNYAFRIRFEGLPDMCSLNENWAYIESTDLNYETKVSTLLSAFAMGANVGIHTELNRNHCHLINITNISK